MIENPLVFFLPASLFSVCQVQQSRLIKKKKSYIPCVIPIGVVPGRQSLRKEPSSPSTRFLSQ